jgi:hypothetical protein
MISMRPKSLLVVFVLVAGTSLSSCTEDAPALPPDTEAASIRPAPPPRRVVVYPDKPNPGCRDGEARILDECGDQVALFEKARAHAKAEGKTLLVEYGAEWWISCHVFAAHIKGKHGWFRYTYGSPEAPDQREAATFMEGKWADADAARELSEYVANHFVLVHIDAAHAPNGAKVLESTGAAEYFSNAVPFVYTVDEDGRFASALHQDLAERRRDGALDWYRGYDRRNLLAQLEQMREAALATRARCQSAFPRNSQLSLTT